MYMDKHGNKWYKGNLHTHTVRSDGKHSYEEVITAYRHAGYDFLSITDHWITSETVDDNDFLLLSGCEYDTLHVSETSGAKSDPRTVHINAIGFTQPPEIKRRPGLTQQEIVDSIHDKGGIAIFNHPRWSRNLTEDILVTDGYDGIEIFNSECDSSFVRLGCSATYVDQAATCGYLIPVMATDDLHTFGIYAFCGFIMVRAENLSRLDILQAIREKRFFSSQGPWVQAHLQDNTVYIECSPVSSMCVYTNTINRYGQVGREMTGARFDLHDEVRYFRVEVIDENGKKAWTHPVSTRELM